VGTVAIKGVLKWPDTSTHVTIQGLWTLNNTQLQPFLDILDNDDNNNDDDDDDNNDNNDDDDQRLLDTYIQQQLFNGPPNGHLNFTVHELTWGLPESKGWLVGSEWHMDVLNGNTVGGAWKVRAAYKTVPLIPNNAMRWHPDDMSVECELSEDWYVVRSKGTEERNQERSQERTPAWSMAFVELGKEEKGEKGGKGGKREKEKKEKKEGEKEEKEEGEDNEQEEQQKEEQEEQQKEEETTPTQTWQRGRTMQRNQSKAKRQHLLLSHNSANTTTAGFFCSLSSLSLSLSLSSLSLLSLFSLSSLSLLFSLSLSLSSQITSFHDT